MVGLCEVGRRNMSPNSGPKRGHFAAPGHRFARTVAGKMKCHALFRCFTAFIAATLRSLALACAAASAAPALADPQGALAFEVLVRDEVQARILAQRPAEGGAPRIEISVGELDSRLRLAPCTRMEPYLPAGLRPWGRTRIGVRCVEGPTRWNVFLPVTVRVYAEAWVARGPLAAGAVISESDLARAEVDIAAAPDPVVADVRQAVGRTLARAIAAGEPFRTTHLRPIQWFAAGDTVKVVGVGRGFTVVGEGRALGAGLHGQKVRVRTDGGRILVGVARAAQTVEVRL